MLYNSKSSTAKIIRSNIKTAINYIIIARTIYDTTDFFFLSIIIFFKIRNKIRIYLPDLRKESLISKGLPLIGT